MPSGHRVKHCWAGHREAEGGCGSWTPRRSLGQPAAQVPGQGVGKGQETQRLRRRSTVDDDDVPVTGPDSLTQRDERGDLIGAGQGGQLLRDSRVDPDVAQESEQVVLDDSPGRRQPVGSTDVLGGQSRLDLDRSVSQVGGERVSEGVRPSVDMMRVRAPRRAASTPRAAAVVVLPTPPLPVQTRTLGSRSALATCADPCLDV